MQCEELRATSSKLMPHGPKNVQLISAFGPHFSLGLESAAEGRPWPGSQAQIPLRRSRFEAPGSCVALCLLCLLGPHQGHCHSLCNTRGSVELLGELQVPVPGKRAQDLGISLRATLRGQDSGLPHQENTAMLAQLGKLTSFSAHSNSRSVFAARDGA